MIALSRALVKTNSGAVQAQKPLFAFTSIGRELASEMERSGVERARRKKRKYYHVVQAQKPMLNFKSIGWESASETE